jgi:SAM-dependent MidA family methyltransferase
LLGFAGFHGGVRFAPILVVSMDYPATPSNPGALALRIAREIESAGGWLPFDRYMALALYAPGLGYYMRSDRQFGSLPASGSDFVTAPELSPLYGRALAHQLRQAMDAGAGRQVWEFGAGSGVLARELLDTLGDAVERYTIVELSGALRARQQATLAPYADKLRWVDALPPAIEGVIVGNEVLDAMPVQLLCFDGQQWCERGVALADSGFAWADRPTLLSPPHAGPYPAGYLTELHAQAQAWVRTLAERLQRGAVFLIDYGFPAAEYYHPQRSTGTLMCHRAHRADTDPLLEPGDKDITAHVDFTGIALAAQDAGLDVLGYTSQGRFLINCGIAELMAAAELRERVHAQRLLNEHEMGELFKVIGLARGCSFDPIGFAAGDRTHRL